MGVKNRIKERISDAKVKSYYRSWYKRTSGKIFLILSVLILLLVVYFIIKVSINYNHVRKGDTYNQELNIWLTEEQYIANQKILADIMTDDDPWLGSENPIINIVAYESFACPFCKEDQESIKKVIEKFGLLLRFTTKDTPMEGLHPGVFNAHLAAACANEQGVYWEYHDLLFENQGNFDNKNLKFLAKNLGIKINQFDECLDNEKYASEIRQDYAEGVDLDIQGTPTYVINGSVINGGIPYEYWEEIIGYILKEEL